MPWDPLVAATRLARRILAENCFNLLWEDVAVSNYDSFASFASKFVLLERDD